MTAQELKQFLDDWALSQTAASRLFGVKQQVISEIVTGKRSKRPMYIQREFLFFSLLSEEDQHKLINEAEAIQDRPD